jgi:phosphatidylserine/phosphatidylglycerophosphate/cardiolipin synthase-like enzyme
MFKSIVVTLSLFYSLNAFSLFTQQETLRNAKYDVCFTPGGHCTDLIVAAISAAKKELLIQAYSFTSAPIAKAVVDAQNRGINVRVILDKSQFSEKYSSAKFLQHERIPVWEDNRVAIAHNKVMIIDDRIVITGSFNFTKAAQNKNAENVLIISDDNLAHKYKNNWINRMNVSDKVSYSAD